MASPFGGFNTLGYGGAYGGSPLSQYGAAQYMNMIGQPNYMVQPMGGGYNYGGTPYSLQPVDPTTQLLQSIAPFIGGVTNLAAAPLDMSTSREAAGMADPFSGERQQYMTALRQYMGQNQVNPAQVTAGTNNALSMLTNLLQNPSSLTSMPGYQFGLGQALEGVNRGAGASGLLNSGNRLVALEDQGNRYAQGWQNQIFNQLLGNVGANVNAANLGLAAQGQGEQQLAQLGGAYTGNPAVAGSLLNAGRQQQMTNAGQGLGGIANGLAGGLGALQRMLNSGTPSLTSLMNSGGINAGTLDQGGTLGDFADFNMGDYNGLLDSTYNLGTSTDIFSGLMDAFG